jgi:hypothetical protein
MSKRSGWALIFFVLGAVLIVSSLLHGFGGGPPVFPVAGVLALARGFQLQRGSADSEDSDAAVLGMSVRFRLLLVVLVGSAVAGGAYYAFMRPPDAHAA